MSLHHGPRHVIHPWCWGEVKVSEAIFTLAVVVYKICLRICATFS